jgi:hypothetical protein
MGIRSGLLTIFVIALVIFARGALPDTRPVRPDTPAAVQIQMKNVNYRISPTIVLEVRTLRGELQRTDPDTPVTFDDRQSFIVAIDQAEVALSPVSLASLMNSYVLAYEHSPLKNISVATDGDRLIQKGTIHKGVDLPFEIEGSVSATSDGEIRFHAEKIKAGRLPVKGLLHFFGEDLSKLVNQNAGRGMKVVGDDVILSPSLLTPPPHLRGRIARVSIERGKVVQFFDSGRHTAVLNPPLRSHAYIYHRGGILRFGKLTMNDADLEIVGDRPGPFDFFQQEYKKQLTAGYSKNTAADGLVSHMVDYSRFVSGTRRSTESAHVVRSGEVQRFAH